MDIMKIEENRYVIARLRSVNGVDNDKITMPNLAYSVMEVVATVELIKYRYFWFETIDMTIDRGDGIYTVKTQIQNQSGKYFINAYVEEYADVLVNNQHLAQQMTNLGWTHIARNIGSENYWTECFDPERDKLVDLEGNIIGV